MATVTMSGKEYEEMLMKQYTLEAKIASVEEWLKDSVHLEFPEGSFNKWGAGQMVGIAKLPQWMHDIMFEEVARQLMCQEVDTLKKLEDNGAHYYSPFNLSLSNYNGEDVLPYFKGLAKVWECAHADNEDDKATQEQEDQKDEG